MIRHPEVERTPQGLDEQRPRVLVSLLEDSKGGEGAESVGCLPFAPDPLSSRRRRASV
jgi:hypothetical protein